MNLTITFATPDSALAQRIQSDAARLPSERDTLIAVLSPQAVSDPGVQQAINEALDADRAIVPVLTKPVVLPRLIEHLPAVDFSDGYDFDLLAEQVRTAQSAGAFHMKVRTPGVKASNRRTGYIVAAAAIVMFLLGLYGVGVLGIQRPEDEYEAVETEVILTRDSYINNALPRSTEDAANFQATVRAAAPTLRPILAATATSLAAGTPQANAQP
jgi:hypothetical protein